MSSASITSLTSPLEHSDIRSAAQPFKRDKDHGEKWSMGSRPLAGVRMLCTGELGGGSDAQREKVRPMKQMGGGTKSHANKTAKPTFCSYGQHGASTARLDRKVDAILLVNDHNKSPLSSSLLDLFPQHANNTSPSVQTLVRESSDAGLLYSYDNKGASPGVRGREVDLSGLVEMAEEKWASEQTDRIVKGEYEVLDKEGETTVLLTGKGKKRGSPKQKAVKHEPAFVKKVEAEDDDGFELI